MSLYTIASVSEPVEWHAGISDGEIQIRRAQTPQIEKAFFPQ